MALMKQIVPDHNRRFWTPLLDLQWIQRIMEEQMGIYHDRRLYTTEEYTKYCLLQIEQLFINTRTHLTWLNIFTHILTLGNVLNTPVFFTKDPKLNVLDDPYIHRGKEFMIDKDFHIALNDLKKTLEERDDIWVGNDIISEKLFALVRVVVFGVTHYRKEIIAQYETSCDDATLARTIYIYEFFVYMWMRHQSVNVWELDMHWNHIYQRTYKTDPMFSAAWVRFKEMERQIRGSPRSRPRAGDGSDDYDGDALFGLGASPRQASGSVSQY